MQYSADSKCSNSQDRKSNIKSKNVNSSSTGATVSFLPGPKYLTQTRWIPNHEKTDLTGVPGLKAGIVDSKERIHFVII